LVNPEYDSAHNNLGFAYLLKGDYPKAIEQFREAITINSGNFIYYANLGDAHRALKEYDEAIHNYTKALDINPEDDISYNGLGICFSSKEKYSKAIQQYQKAVAIYPLPVYYANMGDVYRILKNWDEAIKQYDLAVKKASEISPSAVTFRRELGLAYNDRGVKYYEMGEVDRAIEDYSRAVEYIPEDPTVHHNLYLAHNEKGMYKEAEESLLKAIMYESEPDKKSTYSRELEALKTKT